MKGCLHKGLLKVHSMYNRHEELVGEMKRRGDSHFSDLDEKWKFTDKSGYLDRRNSLEELVRRCQKCRMFFENRGLPS